MNDSLKLGRLAGVKVGANWSLVRACRCRRVLPGYFAAPRRCTGLLDRRLLVGRSVCGRCPARRGARSRDCPRRCRPPRPTPRRRHHAVVHGGRDADRRESNRNPSTELVVALVGPIASGVVGAVSIGLAFLAQDAGWSLTAGALRWLGLINLLLGVFNLLPAAPLDGGRVLHGRDMDADQKPLAGHPPGGRGRHRARRCVRRGRACWPWSRATPWTGSCSC